MRGIVATAETEIDAPAPQVWAALTEPEQVKEWMFGTTLETDWQVGSPITWSGEYEGKSYEDRGEVVTVDEPRRLSVTHFSPLSGQDDVPDNYHNLNYTLAEDEGTTRVTLTQDNNDDEAEAERSSGNWEQALQALKAHLES